MKEAVHIKAVNEKYKAKEVLVKAVIHILAGIAGLIASRAAVLGKFLPFGLSVLAGFPVAYTPAVAIGAFAGYFIPAVGNGAFRYIAALFAILAVRLLSGSYKKLSDNPYFLSVICLIANLLTAAAAFKGMNLSVLNVLTESLICAGASYFICRASLGILKNEAGLSGEELVSVLITIGIFICSAAGINIGGTSLSGILSVTLILISSKYGGVLSGAAAGAVVSFAAIISGDTSAVGTSYAIAGLVCGIFSGLGKYAEAGVVLVCCFLGSAINGDLSVTVAVMAEALIGSLIFLLIPRSAGIYFGKIFSAYPRITVPAGLKKSVSMRLQMSSNALKDVSETVEQVAKELSKINSPDFGTVLSGVEQDACAGCKLRIHCWESRKSDTVSALLEMTKAVKQGELNPEAKATEEFKGRCLRLSRMGNSVYKRYSDYASRIAAESRIDEVRSVVSDQFNGISSMLNDLADDFEKDEQFDNSEALKAAAALKNLNIIVDECSSRIDRYGRITIELKLKRTNDLIINKLQIMKMVSLACERDFDTPSVSEVGGDIFISLTEHADYSVDVGVHQICACASSMCGDAYRYFKDARGHFTLVLSDGMGTGGRAAVDGAMASGLMARLLKAGFGYDCSLKILNSSMLFKSTDESLATVDIASIDLFTGNTELYKAGAAPTIVRRSGRTGKAESTSLPAGILRNIGFDKAKIKLKPGDILLLMSDGAVSEGTDWIRAELEAWRDGSAEDLASHICECAKRRRTDNHEDDITVMAAILEKAV
ncbi:MAG: SpoIIE family protein phosphatase [Clostridia bacterium]|nr:SpoIIE family protein phosphatase [Clostridia bacterium]